MDVKRIILEKWEKCERLMAGTDLSLQMSSSSSLSTFNLLFDEHWKIEIKLIFSIIRVELSTKNEHTTQRICKKNWSFVELIIICSVSRHLEWLVDECIEEFEQASNLKSHYEFKRKKSSIITDQWAHWKGSSMFWNYLKSIFDEFRIKLELLSRYEQVIRRKTTSIVIFKWFRIICEKAKHCLQQKRT